MITITAISSSKVKPPVQALVAGLSTFRFKESTLNAGAAFFQADLGTLLMANIIKTVCLRVSEQKPVVPKQPALRARTSIKVNIYYFTGKRQLRGRFFGKETDFR
ncbi:MAG: hypothetical protein LBQ87_09275 [Candidatus Fibromonas sp.]|jgi:hypothetical protein|nr:hypothetical protein [Candidatus Fibromonas sp.]